jgi:hypothetical protein
MSQRVGAGRPPNRLPRALIWALRGLAAVLALIVAAFAFVVWKVVTPSNPGFATLSQIAATVPVPPGVRYVNQDRAVQRGEDLFMGSWNEVDRNYATSLPCSELESRWLRALRDAGWDYQLEVDPHLYASSGAIRIWVTGRGVNLSIYVGDINPDDCQTPSVSASGSPGLSL